MTNYKESNDKLLYYEDIYNINDKNTVLLEMLKSFERSRMFLYKSLENNIDLLKSIPETFKLAEKLSDDIAIKYNIEHNESRIKLTIFDYLPTIYIKTANEAAGYFSEKWKTTINNAIRSLNVPTINEIYVYIKMFIPVTIRIIDVDNKYFKPIFDGISRSGIIQDYCIKHIKSFGFDFIENEKIPRTEVYIFKKNMREKISSLVK